MQFLFAANLFGQPAINSPQPPYINALSPATSAINTLVHHRHIRPSPFHPPNLSRPFRSSLPAHLAPRPHRQGKAHHDPYSGLHRPHSSCPPTASRTFNQLARSRVSPLSSHHARHARPNFPQAHREPLQADASLIANIQVSLHFALAQDSGDKMRSGKGRLLVRHAGGGTSRCRK